MSDETSETIEKKSNGWHDRFLEALASSGNVRHACRASGTNRSKAYRHRDTDPAFATGWDEAIEEATDLLEKEARRRAVRGTLKPVYYKGAKVGTIREYSDTLLIFLLKANRPEKYRENFDMAKLMAALRDPKPDA